MKLIDIIEAINTCFSIHVIKKDGTFGDSAIVSYKGTCANCVAEAEKARKIAKREDLVLDMIITNNDGDILISVQEV